MEDITDIIVKALQYYIDNNSDEKVEHVLNGIERGSTLILDDLVEPTNDAMRLLLSDIDLSDADNMRRIIHKCSSIMHSEQSVINSVINASTKHQATIDKIFERRY